MYRMLTTVALCLLAVILACSSPTPTPVPTVTPEPVATSVPTPTTTPEPAPKPVQTPTTTPEPEASGDGAAPDDGALTPLQGSRLDLLFEVVSEGERVCVAAVVTPERLEELMADASSATDDEGMVMVNCLERDTMLRLFLAGILDQTGPLTVETSQCIRAGFESVDIGSAMTALASTQSGSGDPSAGLSLFAGVFSALSCLNEEEWEAAAPALGMEVDGREALQCVIDELGGLQELAALRGPDAGPPMALFSAAATCELDVFGGG